MATITTRTRYRVDGFLTAEELARLDRVAIMHDSSRAGFVRDAIIMAVLGVERARGLGPVPLDAIAAARQRSPINKARQRREQKGGAR